MRNITAALASLTPLLTQIADISGVPGVSIGVFHEGNAIFCDSIGYRDLEQKLPATSDTVYPIGSLSKAFTSSIYGNLVEQGVVDWNSPIRGILPEFHSRSPEVEHLTNAIDLLSHRTGITEGESFYFHAQPLLNDTSLAAVYAGLQPVQPFRSTIQYNNLGYSLVSQLMSRVTQKSYGDLLEGYINQPLGLERTGVEFDRREPSDTAKKYIVADDGSVIQNAKPLYYEGTHMICIWRDLELCQ